MRRKKLFQSVNDIVRDVGWVYSPTEFALPRGSREKIGGRVHPPYAAEIAITMGYDIQITRTKDCNGAEAAPITLDEWLAVVDADPEMRLDDLAETSTPDGALRYDNPGLAVWTAYSGHEAGGNMPWFDFRRGRIVVKNPNNEILAKMKHLSLKLGAKVVGDEGEEY